MNKLFEFLEKYLMGPMGKVSTWRPVRAIVAAGMASIPFTIVGSAFLVLSVIPQAFNLQFIVDLWANSFDKIQALYLLAYKCTMGILSLYFAIVIGYEYTKIYVEEEGLNLNPLNGGLLAVFAYFLTIPELTYSKGMISAVTGKTTIGGWTVGVDSLTRLSTACMFTAILMSILFGTDIYKVIAIPFAFVSHITNTWLGIVVIYLLVHALWIVGIHGANIVMGLVNPILLANMAQNVDGKFIAYAGEFTNSYVTIGGSGATLLLCFYIAFRAKSDQLRMLGKASMGPAIFNINEPFIFGLPIVYNPMLTIPFILAPIVSASIGYWSVQLGLAGKAIAQTPWPTPIGIGAYVGSGGNIGAFVVALICALAAFVIWYPFIKMYDTKLYKEEMNSAEAIQ